MRLDKCQKVSEKNHVIVCSVVEFVNGLETDKAHPFIEDCIAKQDSLIKASCCFIAGCISTYIIDIFCNGYCKIQVGKQCILDVWFGASIEPI